ncbi:TraB/GumN family protein [Treponema ruminis]|uniref:Pheromone shutdown-related protein TraB n=1 Tax=Treponema ruminis TaxID=744515 RepID=A0A7W8G6W3_9SPIR|nr:TraB/GumN family protein [Treponema ruminis]MBB5224921.1 pheromone shutdown-related protein TraB [Treponema ruminis]
MSQINLNLNGKEIVLLGTAHVSQQSCDEVKAAIAAKKPDCVAIELDEQRYASLNDSEAWKNLDIIKVLREKKGFLLLANIVLSSFQKRMGANVGVKPGDEMRAGIDAAKELGIPCEMVDRPIQTTLRRAWAKNSGYGRIKLLSALFASAASKEEVSGDEIENLKNKSEMDGMMAELADFMPGVKEVLIDERDFYLAAHIWEAVQKEERKSVVAVLGAGHLPGVQAHLEKIAAGSENTDTEEISSLPKKKVGAKIIGWAIPVVIVGLIAAGFVFGGMKKGADLLSAWVIWNAVLAGIGALVAGGHPLTILMAAVGAPFTSLCPLVGVGMFAGIVQAFVCKPKVADMESMMDDVSSVKGFYKNRLLRVLLVLFLSSIGSSIGTFVGGSSIVVSIVSFFKGLFGK